MCNSKLLKITSLFVIRNLECEITCLPMMSSGARFDKFTDKRYRWCVTHSTDTPRTKSLVSGFTRIREV